MYLARIDHLNVMTFVSEALEYKLSLMLLTFRYLKFFLCVIHTQTWHCMHLECH